MDLDHCCYNSTIAPHNEDLNATPPVLLTLNYCRQTKHPNCQILIKNIPVSGFASLYILDGLIRLPHRDLLHARLEIFLTGHPLENH